MTEQEVYQFVEISGFTLLRAVMPFLLIGLVLGLVVSIIQTVTSIQEQTLSFVPKIIAIFLAVIIFMPTTMDIFRVYFDGVIDRIINIG